METKTVWRYGIIKNTNGYNYCKIDTIQMTVKQHDQFKWDRLNRIDVCEDNKIVFLGTKEIIEGFVNGIVFQYKIDEIFSEMLDDYCSAKSQEKPDG